ncbi:MAG TPA: class I SAM-dependent methyltransferase [Magnetospirillaceae bacterium]|jgi:cyclopropane-fatty-acyl-phospholipid synthase
MDDGATARAPATATPASLSGPMGFLLRRFSSHFANVSIPFDVKLPDGAIVNIGKGTPAFHVTANNKAGLRALASLDEGKFGDAYVQGDLDLEGDLLAPFAMRGTMKDNHFITWAWRFIQPLLFGQVHTNKKAISAHYDLDPGLFESFLDPITPCYTQGVYLNDDETLDIATTRKFEWCFEKLGLKAGDRILEIGPGWGAWFEYASKRGVKCTGITISKVSKEYLDAKAKRLGFDWEILMSDLLEYKTDKPYDAIVIMGVIEHLPNYLAVAEKFKTLVKPGGKIFLDGSATVTKYELSSFMVKYIYAGNHSFLDLGDFISQISKTSLRATEIWDDRHSYFLTFRQWARNLDANRATVVQKYGDFNFRRFRLYLWGAAWEFWGRSLDCYRLILESPADIDPRAPL